MASAWFVLVAFMITAYVVLDGFDLGAGVLHLVIARTDQERRTVLRTIGPVWDGNEVWLVAGGGTLYFAFPLLYASAFSGFYLPLMIVLWLLIVRAIGIEFRTHLDIPLWQSFFDGLFAISSALLAVFFGAALGNVVRGVPLRADHTFFEALWTNWRVGANPGILDWYTVLTGILALVALTVHGALYLRLKTTGALAQRALLTAMMLWWVEAILTIGSLAATLLIRRDLIADYLRHPFWFVIPVIVVSSLIAIPIASGRDAERFAFLASSVYLAAMLAGAAAALYPNLLPATSGPANNLTIYNAANTADNLRIGLYWWLPGIAIAITYFVIVYHMFRGKVAVQG